MVITTQEDFASPFATTDEAPVALRERALRVMQRARKRAAAQVPKGGYWEEPGLHGLMREVNLRKSLGMPLVRGARPGARGSINSLPAAHQSTGVSDAVLVGAVVVGAGALAWWLLRPKTQVRGDLAGIAELSDALCG